MPDFKECDLYQPVKEYFNLIGYEVKAEINDCDLVAVKDNEIIIAELKTSFCLKLVYQAIERQSISNFVYIVIPRPKKGAKSKEWKSMLKLMKKLDIGIITVSMDSKLRTVDIVSTPQGITQRKNPRKRTQLGNEFNQRNINTNTGGVNKTKILTAYKEKCIFTLCLIERYGTITPAKLKLYLDDKYADRILRSNYYGWFEKIDKGIYGISIEGKKILIDDNFKKAVEFYQKKTYT